MSGFLLAGAGHQIFLSGGSIFYGRCFLDAGMIEYARTAHTRFEFAFHLTIPWRRLFFAAALYGYVSERVLTSLSLSIYRVFALTSLDARA